MFLVEQVWPIFGPVEADRDNIAQLSRTERRVVEFGIETKKFNI